ncbi:MAG: RDD family protein [Lysobacteraceae bacterium]
MSASAPPQPPAPIATPAPLGWRVVALAYDLFPVLALAFAGSALMLLARGGTPVNPGSAGAYAETAWLWALCGAYFVASWRRGGQTLGMRPWRLRVVANDGRLAGWRALATRYAVATLPALGVVELAALGAWPEPMVPFWLAGAVALAGPLAALFDGENRALYERWSGTRLVRLTPADGTR